MAMNDQTAKRDAGKLELMHVPPEIIEDIAEVRMYGNRKYGDPDNWRTVEEERYWNALFRHLVECMRDPEAVDPESGIKHYKHIACNIAFICALEREKQEKIITVDELMEMAEPNVIRVPHEILGDDCASRDPEAVTVCGNGEPLITVSKDPEIPAKYVEDEVRKRDQEEVANRKECQKCRYISNSGAIRTCDYCYRTGKARGVEVSKCDHWKDSKRRKTKAQIYRHVCRTCGAAFESKSAGSRYCQECAEVRKNDEKQRKPVEE